MSQIAELHIPALTLGWRLKMALSDASVKAGDMAVQLGVDLRTVQELLRHSSLATTQIYTAVSDTRRREGVERLSLQQPAA